MDEKWITVNGNRVLIKDGETVQEAMDRQFGTKKADDFDADFEEEFGKEEFDSEENDYVSQFAELSNQYINAKTKAEREAINDKMNELKRKQFPEDYEEEETSNDYYLEEFYKEAKGDKEKFINHFINRFGIPKGSSKQKEIDYYSKKFDEMSEGN